MHSTAPSDLVTSADKVITELISPERLAPYRTACAGDPEAALALYCWNSELAAAFFQQIGHLEIILRNALDARLVLRQQRRGRAVEWYDDRSIRLGDRSRADIDKAYRRAQRGDDVPPRGKIIAELSFGFWRFLLARQHKGTLWPDLARAFPYAPDEGRVAVENPVKRLHALRNRIAHHEGIWHLSLADYRDNIQTVLGFIDPAVASWVAGTSRIDETLTRRPHI
ncbi:Abi family protein [Streptomyces cinereoruber]|uniref:Abi family protein n=1 Tax=Streptomyces cinereoruber TaxID=67260 RepID=UPI00363E27B6